MPTNVDATDEIEIDVMRIITPVLSRWRIIGLVLILVLAGRGSFLFLDQSFSAQASLAIVKTRTDVQFDQRIRTSQPEFQAATLIDNQRNTLVEMALSTRLAVRTIQKFADRLPQKMSANAMLAAVSAEIVPRSDVILINVQMKDAKLAADIATFWAQEFEKESNAVLSGVTPDYVAQVNAELQRAVTELDQVQSDYVTALKQSQADALRLTINQKVREMDRLEALRLLPTLGSLQRKQSSLGAVAAIGQMQERMRQLKTAATMMRMTLQNGGAASAASNAMALAALKTQVFTVVSAQSTAMAQLDLTTSSQEETPNGQTRSRVQQQSISPLFPSNVSYFLPSEAFSVLSFEEQTRDLDALIKALTDFDGQLTRDIQTALASNDAIVAPLPENLAEIDAEMSRVKEELRQARAGLEEETFLTKQLEQKRNTLRDSVQALRAKRAEVDVSSGVANSYVRLVSEAIEPTMATSNVLRNLATAGAAGLGVGILIALVLAIRAGDYRRLTQEA